MSKNIINIGDKKFITDTFLVGDMENIYLKKNEIDHIKNDRPKDAYKLYTDFLEMLYEDIEVEYREYVFIYNLIVSEGKSNYKMSYKCPSCQKETSIMFSIELNNDFYKYKIVNNIDIVFRYTNGGKLEDMMNYIQGIQQGDYFIKWDRLSEDTKENIISHIDPKEYVNIFQGIQMCRAVLKGHGVKCCDKGVIIPKDQKIFGGYEIFSLLVNSANLTSLYQLNHQLLSRGISLSDQLMMKPYERNIYITMIVKKEQEELKKHEKGGVFRG